MGDKVQLRSHGRGGEKAFFPCELDRVGLAYAPRQRKSEMDNGQSLKHNWTRHAALK